MDKAELRGLVERVDQIRSMMSHPGWGLLSDYIQAQIVAKNRSLLSNAPKTLEEYRWQAGWIVGAQAVLTAAEGLQKQVEVRMEEAA